jgi:EAL domain-containing protein (putative c-di-GMP-specific phosphodiesterase class I)
MSKSNVTVTVVLAMLFLAIVGFCAWSALHGGPTELILGGAIIILGLAQLLSFTARDHALNSALRRVTDIMGAYGALTRELHAVTRRVATIEGQAMLEHAGSQPSASREWLQRSLQRPQRRVEPAPSPRAAIASAPPAPERQQSELRQQSAPPAAPANRSGESSSSQFEEERFDLYLEPIVQIDDGATRHYRGSLSLRMSDGTRVGMETIQHQATKAGLMPMLDYLTVTRVFPVLRKLMQRQRGVGIFCTVSAAALADHDFISKLLTLISQNAELAKGLVLEIKQPTFTGLSPEGQASIAKLAEQGVTFCLGDVDGHGPGVLSLADIGFHYVAVDIMTLANASSKQAEETLGNFTRDAAFHGLEVIAANVSTRTELAAVTARASLGYGGLFSPPRLVRHEIGSNAAAAAAA